MIWPLISTACGMKMAPPSRRAMSSAIVVLPFPGSPCRKMEPAELTAGPSIRNRASSRTSCSNSRSTVPGVTRTCRRDCFRIQSSYVARGTGAGPTYWLTSMASRARSRPESVRSNR